MVQLAGKYQLIDLKNFYEFLVGLGLPEAAAKESSQIKGTLEVAVDGDKITIANNNSDHVANLVLGKAVEEQFGEHTVMSTAKLDGNVLAITGTTKDGEPAFSRTLTFTDNGIEVVMTAPKDGKTLTATSAYKRI